MNEAVKFLTKNFAQYLVTVGWSGKDKCRHRRLLRQAAQECGL